MITMGLFDHRNQYADEEVLFELSDEEDSKTVLGLWESSYRQVFELLTDTEA